MLTNYFLRVPLSDKRADAIVHAYIREVYCNFSGSYKTFTNNRSEFKNKLFSEVAAQLGIKHIFLSPNRLQTDGRSEPAHKFLKILFENLLSVEMLNEIK